jgi:hypothetical protein
VIAAALRYCREQTTRKKVVAFVCDTGNKYLSKMYNDYWMLRQRLHLERESTGDLRDLINRPYAERDTVVVAPERDPHRRLPADEAVRRLAAAGDGRRPHRRHRRRVRRAAASAQQPPPVPVPGQRGDDHQARPGRHARRSTR